jgi:predicted ATP-binding protein involved in virulence
LKRNLRSCQAIYSEPVNKTKAAIIAFYKIKKSWLRKKENLFEDGNVIKERLFLEDNSLSNN